MKNLIKTKTYIISEIGINHNSSLDIAKKLIDVASVAGCDAVKFQKREPETCVPKHQWNIMRDTPWGRMSYIDYKKKMEFGREEYDEIDLYCLDKDIDWSASPWDVESLKFLLQYDIPWIKIPSAMLTNDDLLAETAESGIPVIMSTGMTTDEELDHAMKVLFANGMELDNLTLLHCNSSYPAPIDELNLSYINKLKSEFGCRVGYSSHDITVGISVAAVCLGAEVIEKHITLDRQMFGTDQSCSCEPHGLIKLVKGIREVERAIGSPVKVVTEGEKKARLKLRGY